MFNTQKDRIMSPYQITWVEFCPVKGIVTLWDQKRIGGSVMRYKGEKKHYRYFANRREALKWLEEHRYLKLNKRYECRLFTDKQFGMRDRKDDYAVPFTKKQYKEVYFIG